MEMIMCDRCKKAIPKEDYKKYTGVHFYWAVPTSLSGYTDFHLCKKCVKRLIKFLNIEDDNEQE